MKRSRRVLGAGIALCVAAAGVQLVVGGYDVPGGVLRAGRRQAFFVGLGVLPPVGALLDIRFAEFPVLLRVIDAREEAPKRPATYRKRGAVSAKISN